MSSAALQPAPHQATALSSPPLSSASNRQYISPHSSPNRDGYNAQQTAAASPSSRRPPSRKTSGNGGSAAVDLSVPRSSRHTATALPPQDQYRSPNMPPVAPPRTSSSGHQGSTSRRNNYPTDVLNSPPRHGQVDGSRTGSRGGDTNGHSESPRSSKRAVNSHIPSDQTRPSSNRESRPAEIVVPIRSNQSSNSKPSQENNDAYIRQAPSSDEPNGRTGQGSAPQGHHGGASQPVINMNAGTEERRGGRSRQDHSRSHKGTSKFGDFILGNTIGEGEFGKVKLGWKQDSSVQVGWNQPVVRSPFSDSVS